MGREGVHVASHTLHCPSARTHARTHAPPPPPTPPPPPPHNMQLLQPRWRRCPTRCTPPLSGDEGLCWAGGHKTSSVHTHAALPIPTLSPLPHPTRRRAGLLGCDREGRRYLHLQCAPVLAGERL